MGSLPPAGLPLGHDPRVPARCRRAPDRSEARRGQAEQDGRWIGAVVGVPVRDAGRERDRIALAQDVVLVAHPQVEDAAQDDDDLLVRLMGVRVGAGTATRPRWST